MSRKKGFIVIYFLRIIYFMYSVLAIVHFILNPDFHSNQIFKYSEPSL